MQGWLVYLLRCGDGTLYCGITNDLERRLAAHGRGRVKYTRGRLPVEVAHVEPAADKSAALRAEAKWKRLPRREKLRRISLPKSEPTDDRDRRTCVSRGDSVSARNAEPPDRDARRRRERRLR